MQINPKEAIIESLAQYFSSELVVAQELTDCRTINESNSHLSVQLFHRGLNVGGNGYYDYTSGRLSISRGHDTEYLCLKYTGKEVPESYKYNIVVLWDEGGYTLVIGPDEYTDDMDSYLKENGIDVTGFIKKLNSKYEELIS